MIKASIQDKKHSELWQVIFYISQFPLQDNIRNIEVKLRLSNQKLRITEKLLTEKEESFRIAEQKYLEEKKALEERVATLFEAITTHQRMIKDILEKENDSINGLQTVIHKFDRNLYIYIFCSFPCVE